MKNEKINIFQIVAIYILVSIVPVVRYFPIIMAESAGKAAWLAAIVCVAPSIVLVWILHELMNKVKRKDNVKIDTLADVFDSAYGKIIGSIITFVYLIWILIFAATELRLFAERLISTTYIYAPIIFFILTMLILVFFVVRGKIVNFGRFAELFVELFILVFMFIIITSSQTALISERI